VSEIDLAGALAAEAEGRFLEGFGIVHAVLSQTPHDADALNLLGRLCLGGGDLVSAISLQRLVLQLVPEHERARADLAAALAATPDAAGGAAAFAAACAIEPEIALHHRIPSSLAPFAHMDEVRTLLETAVRCDPGLAGSHAALGNLLVRDDRGPDALAAYRRAAGLDPRNAASQLAVAEIAHVLGDAVRAERHRVAALALQRLYAEPVRAAETRLRILVLQAPEPWTAQVSLDLVADRTRLVLHRLYLDGDDAVIPALPDHDAVFNAMGVTERAAPAIAAAQRFIAGQTKPSFNAPHALLRTARPSLPSTLRGIEDCVVPAATRRSRAELRDFAREGAQLDGIAFPLVVRPVDAHGGSGLARVETGSELDRYVALAAAESFDLSQYVDYRDADGWYRKYRVMLVDGEPHAYHLAISASWIVHYQTSATPDHRWMQDEEERFLSEPQLVFANWPSTFSSIGTALGLDYVGLDCARLPDGRVLVFEADPASWVHAHDAAAAPYRVAAVEGISRALTEMLERHSGR
jgi:tetratricopeptide (TPR) repeat protein